MFELTKPQKQIQKAAKGFAKGEFDKGPANNNKCVRHMRVGRIYCSAMRFSSALISRRRSLPTFDLGSMSRNSIYWGTL